MTHKLAPSSALIVTGAAGKLGSRIIALSRTRFEHAAIFGVVRPSRARNATADAPALSPIDSVRVAPGAAVTIVDASSDEGARAAIALGSRLLKESHRVSLLICTTALSPTTLEAARQLADRAAVLVTPNTSLGVAAFVASAGLLARVLGPRYQATIIEAHHDQKKDAPSGTARRLTAAIRQAGVPVPDASVHSIRAGDVIGEHTLRLTGPGEVIELSHRATTRDLFARGALELAAWLFDAAPGMRSMEEFVTLRTGAAADRGVSD